MMQRFLVKNSKQNKRNVKMSIFFQVSGVLAGGGVRRPVSPREYYPNSLLIHIHIYTDIYINIYIYIYIYIYI